MVKTARLAAVALALAASASTLAVAGAAHWAELAGLGGFARTFAIEAANVTAFGSLWATQYVLLDRVLFRHDQQMVVANPGRELHS